MDRIPRPLVDQMMVRCARRCCICRRFQPTKLHVHHIVQRKDGGTNDEENLIVLCLTCHTDVHSQVPFAVRFSAEELRGHRDALMQMVVQRKFPLDEPDNAEQFIGRIIDAMAIGPRAIEERVLSREAVQILLAAAHASGRRQGMVQVSETNAGRRIFPGTQQCPYDVADRRATAKYRAALEELLHEGLIEHSSSSLLEVTHSGYSLADEIASSYGEQDKPAQDNPPAEPGAEG